MLRSPSIFAHSFLRSCLEKGCLIFVKQLRQTISFKYKVCLLSVFRRMFYQHNHMLVRFFLLLFLCKNFCFVITHPLLLEYVWKEFNFESGKDLIDIHTNHNSKKITILNQFLELNIAIAIR